MSGAEFRKIRLRLGLTQKALAVRLDLGRNSIGRYESGLRRIPRILEMALRCLAYHRP